MSGPEGHIYLREIVNISEKNKEPLAGGNGACFRFRSWCECLRHCNQHKVQQPLFHCQNQEAQTHWCGGEGGGGGLENLEQEEMEK